jgi:sporulation protein YlmC with PRC-barrel domain|nr:PRC-barrel domain-containing protein [Methanobrevibacter smithii]
MNIKEVLGSKVLDKNAYEVGTVSDFDFDQKEGTIESMVVSLKKGVFSKEELEVAFEDIETIGGYVILSKELPEAEETEEEVEVQKVEVEKEE